MKTWQQRAITTFTLNKRQRRGEEVHANVKVRDSCGWDPEGAPREIEDSYAFNSTHLG